MRHHRPIISVRPPADLAVKRDFDIVADARRLETLRQAIRREVKAQTSLRALAQRIGVDRGSLRKFLTMESVPDWENLAKIEEWFEDRADVWTPLGAVALAVLVLDLPGPRRRPARKRLAQVLASAFGDAELPVPEWLDTECAG
ncbi:MAG TPA: helix-turn-helix transcriptional regulator [Longimicrobiaceae bacterium]|nr:helix-turn-helix transcriptional regulator [Longimicrobiaceae bacterium]